MTDPGPFLDADIGPEAHTLVEAAEKLTLLVWRFSHPVLAVSSAPLGGGLGLRRWVVNAQVPHSYARSDPDVHLTELACAVGLGGTGVGMLTAVDLRSISTARDGGARADVSVGVTWPTWAAAPDGDPGGPELSPSPTQPPTQPTPQISPGTVNIVGIIPERLSDAALVNTVMTVTEAKAQALWDAGVRATGTASDAVCVACPAEGPAHLFGGPRSQWGARLARAVHRAVVAGLNPAAP